MADLDLKRSLDPQVQHPATRNYLPFVWQPSLSSRKRVNWWSCTPICLGIPQRKLTESKLVVSLNPSPSWLLFLTKQHSYRMSCVNLGYWFTVTVTSSSVPSLFIPFLSSGRMKLWLWFHTYWATLHYCFPPSLLFLVSCLCCFTHRFRTLPVFALYFSPHRALEFHKHLAFHYWVVDL